MPALQVPGATDATLALANSGSTSASVTLIARDYDGTTLRGPRTNPVSISLPPLNSKTFRPKDLFGEAISTGWIEVQTTSNAITGSFLLVDPSLPTLESAALTSTLASGLIFPKVTTDRSQANTLVLINTSNRRLSRVVVSLFDNSGQAVSQRNISLAPYAGWSGTVSDLIPDLGPFDGYAVVNASSGSDPDALIGFETFRGITDFAALPAMPNTARFETGYVTHFTSQAGYASTLVLVNYGSTPQTVAVTAGALEYNGRVGASPSQTAELTLDPYQRKEVRLDELLDFSGSNMVTGFVRYQTQDDPGGLFGYMELKAAGGGLTVAPVQGVANSNSSFSYTADGSGNYTVLSLLNPGLRGESIRVDAFDTRGYALGTTTVSLGPNGHWSRLLREVIPQTANQIGGSVRISTPGIVLAIQLLGTTISTGALAVVPAQASPLESQQVIPPLSARNGGTVMSTDGSASIMVTPGALLQDMAIKVRALNVEDFPRPTGNRRLVGIVQGTPAGTHFNHPVRVRFPLADTLQPGTPLSVSIFNPATHQFELSEFLATVDSSGRGAWADVTHFTVFGVSAVQSVQISNINPANEAVGSTIAIYGSGFGLSPDENSVLFTGLNGETIATSVLTASADILTVSVPSGASNGNVYVKVGSVTSNGVRFKVDTAANQAPNVSAGSDQSITLPASAVLAGAAVDDGLPLNSNTSVAWSLLSGPGSVSFGNPAGLNTSAAFSAAGTYILRLTASDTELSSSDDVTINVNDITVSSPTNKAPNISAGTGQTITLPAAANLSGTATDDGLPSGALTALWTNLSGPGTVIFGNASAFTTNASFSIEGTYILRLTASDNALNASADVVVTVNAAAPVNQTPVVDAGPSQTLTLPALATLSGTATDDGLPNGTLTKSWTKIGGPGTVSFSSPTALTTTASFSADGTYTVRLSANDNALSASSDVVVVVNAAPPANLAPIVNAGPDQTVAFPAGANLLGSASDDGLPTDSAVTVTWSKVSGPGSVIFVNANSLNASATFLTPGTYTLRLTASDTALTATDDVVITVNAPANQAPTVNAGVDQTIALAASATLSGTAVDDGLPTGSSLTLSWTKVSGPGSVNLSDPSANTTLASFSAPGTYTLRFTATDSALTTTDDVVITVSAAPNQAPTVNAGPDQTIALAASATLSGTAVDDGLPTGSALTRNWSKVSGPGSVNLSNPSANTTLAAFSAPGSYTMRFTATDGALTSSDDLVITVNAAANQAPTVNAGPDQTLASGVGTTLAGTATDDGLPTGSSLTFNWTKVSGPGLVNLGSPAASTTLAAFPLPGTYTMRLTATDGALTATDDVVITVNPPVNQAPIVLAGADQSIALAASATLAGTVIDDGLPTGNTLATTWTKISGPGTVTLSAPSANVTLAAFALPGTYTMRFTATDGALTASDDVLIAVNAPANQAPTVNAGADQSIEITANAVLTGTAVDDGLPTGSLLTSSWTKVSGPGTVTLSNPSANTTLAAFSTPGTYTMRFTASDTAQSTSDDVVLIVSAIVGIGIQTPAPVNQAPAVSAGSSQTTSVTTSSSLSGTATDDGLPVGSTLAPSWTKLSGPGTVAFSNAASLNTMATFSAAGTYVLQLSVSDGALTTRSSVNVVVTQNWGSSNSDAESIFMAAGSLALEGQSGWIYYNGGDAPEGGYMGWLNQNQTLTGNLHLPRQLSPGRYYVFFFGTSYDSNESVRASTGGGTSSSTLINDRDANGLWTDRAVVDVTTASDVLQVVLTRNPAISADQKYLFRGVYITTNDKESVDRSSTVSTLTYPTAMDDSAPVKGNLIPDGGFETGIDAGWGFNGKRTELPIWDSTQHWEGQASIKIPLDHSANAYGDNIMLVSRVYHLKPNKKYTVSMWIKSSGGTVAVSSRLVSALTPPAGSPAVTVPGKFIYASGVWQRINFTGYALDYPTSDYQIYIESNELPGGYLWVDGVQLEEGDLTNYQSSSTVVAGPFITNQPGNIFYDDELISAPLVARNTSSGPATAVFHYEIYDFMNAMVRSGSQNLSLAGQTTTQTPFSLATGKLGIFRIVSWIDGIENTGRELIYSIIPRPAITGADPTSYLGIHPNYTDSELSILQKMGMKWARVLSPSGYFRWSNIEPTEGQIAWYDADIQRGTNHGITTLGTIGTNNYWPAWADNGGLPNLAKWQTFVGRLADHYKSSVLYWEIWNEPNSVFTPDFYAQMLKGAVDAIETNSPNAKIVGMGGVPLSYMQGVITALENRYPTWNWKQHIDVLSTHDYPDGEPPENFKTILSTYGLPVWNTETGSWDRGNYQGVNSSFTTQGKNLWSYTDASRFYTGMMGAPNSVVGNFLRSIANGQTNYFYYDSRAAASPDYPRSHTTILEYDGTVRAKGIAYAIAGSLVDHSIGMGNVSSDQGTYMLVFDRADGPVAALFSGDAKPRQLALGLSPSQYKVLDMMGNPITVVGSIPFGRSPIYIKGIGITAATLKTALQNGGVSTRADVIAPNLSISDAPVGPVSSSSFRARWIGLDDSFLPNLGEINPESNVSSEKPNPDAIVYSYRLQGYTSSWSPWSAQTYIDYSNLPNGSYTFSVMARDAAGNQSPEVSRTIVINAQ